MGILRNDDKLLIAALQVLALGTGLTLFMAAFTTIISFFYTAINRRVNQGLIQRNADQNHQNNRKTKSPVNFNRWRKT
jgi:cytochrome c-type biogenesis protein CcmE